MPAIQKPRTAQQIGEIYDFVCLDDPGVDVYRVNVHMDQLHAGVPQTPLDDEKAVTRNAR